MIDYIGYSIVLGFVDIYIYGFGGVDVMDNNIEGIFYIMSEGLFSIGVISFLFIILIFFYE